LVDEWLEMRRTTHRSANEAGRHTFASQWVLSGGSIEKLREILGHSTVLVTERYAHLKPELFGAADLERANVPLTAA
jgi:site-specific recombinase XerD